ncbi:MAG: PQQ-dependent sugar dehydrogenase, partial [Planctomycetes bacterium]|nr:PQQ-dependent sugar dehydrogenase [Planctomycetota bacterium]
MLAAAFIVASCGSSDGDLHAQDKAAEKGKPEVTDEAASKKLVPDIEWEKVYPNIGFNFPVALVSAPSLDDHLFVVEKLGKIKAFKKEPETKEVVEFFDLSDRMLERERLHNEEGLLSLAFHPKFKDNGYFYVYYTAGDVREGNRGRPRIDKRRSVISRFTTDKKNRLKVDKTSEKVILEIDQPYGNHNGSTMLFGKDGFLYISVGDGGAGGDPLNAGQDLKTMLGKILRIDVDKEEGAKAYSSPKDNPFIKN